MKEDENILERAIKAIGNERIPAGPSQDLVDATFTKLSETQEQSGAASSGGVISLVDRVEAIRSIVRFAAAAVLLIVFGYAVGRISAPRPPDIEELQAALEPAIRRKVVAQLGSDLQAGLATCYDQLSDELSRRQQRDMAQFAAQTLSASSSITNELLAELIEAIDAAQTQDRQWFTAALGQIEADRLRADAQLSTALTSFAVRTEDELVRTKQGVAQLLSYGMPENSRVYEFENSDNPDERREK